MKFNTFCIVAGNQVCTARCKWCVSSMTPSMGVGFGKAGDVDPETFRKACRMAMQSRLDTVRITGKGEPTIFPDQITQYLTHLQPYMRDVNGFTFVELQTHGRHLADEDRVTRQQMQNWAELGMTHICISMVSTDPARNAQHYFPHKGNYYDVAALIAKLHKMRYNVRLTCIMQKGDVDCADKLKEFLKWAKEIRADQVTVLPVNKPGDSRNADAYQAALDSLLTPEQLSGIIDFCKKDGKLVRTLPWGGTVYDMNGQNLCLNYCLTHTPNTDDSRQLIFLPPGTIAYDWEYAAAVLYQLPAVEEAKAPDVIQLGALAPKVVPVADADTAK
ncbi:MAG: radical SAM protein [Candidatus Obscuribacterales bacterium]|nr:radical SAM protein [Candidatus Obscuribacterales bacterium]